MVSLVCANIPFAGRIWRCGTFSWAKHPNYIRTHMAGPGNDELCRRVVIITCISYSRRARTLSWTCSTNVMRRLRIKRRLLFPWPWVVLLEHECENVERHAKCQYHTNADMTTRIHTLTHTHTQSPTDNTEEKKKLLAKLSGEVGETSSARLQTWIDQFQH